MPEVGEFCRVRKTVLLAILVCGAMLWISGCATTPAPETTPERTRPESTKPPTQKPYQVFGKWYHPLSDAKGFRQKGVASWYGQQFHGKKTSNGEIYDMYGMTAAHKTLPLGTYVRVKNLDNGKSIDVRVNDRGPFVSGRIIDLTYTGAKSLGVLGPGTAPVEVTALGMAEISDGKQIYVPVDYEKGAFTIQVGAFLERSNAERLKERLSETFKNAHIVTYFDGRSTFYRVRVGACTTLTQAEAYEKALVDRGYTGAMAVAE